MKTLFPDRILTIFAFVALIAAGNSCSTADADLKSDAAEQAAALSPVDPQAAEIIKLIEKSPESPIGYTQLAVHYIKSARSTGDFGLNFKADEAIEKALAVKPDYLPARKIRASLHLTHHRFAEGLEIGKQLEKEFPDDEFVYGVLTDAYAELGNYPEAVRAAQRMVDLKPNAMSYARVAHLRLLHGDHAGAEEMYKTAARTTDPLDKEGQSWNLVQLADVYFRAGEYAKSERTAGEALEILPGYIPAMVQKGRARAAQGDPGAAETLLAAANERVPQLEGTILLGDIKYNQGKSEEAAEYYRRAEEIARGVSGDVHRLALLWADHDERLDEALKIARNDYAVVKDIYAADILAWCLFKKGLLDEAKSAIDEAMRLKTGDARILYHAGMIEKARGQNAAARVFLAKALKLNPSFDLRQAEAAKRALAELGG